VSCCRSARQGSQGLGCSDGHPILDGPSPKLATFSSQAADGGRVPKPPLQSRSRRRTAYTPRVDTPDALLPSDRVPCRSLRAAASLDDEGRVLEAEGLIEAAEERAIHAGRVQASRTSRKAQRSSGAATGDHKVAAPITRVVGSAMGRFLRNPVEDYLHDLQQDLTGGRSQALARAVPVGGVGRRLTVRLPTAFPGPRGAGERLTIEEYLRGLYEGVIEELVTAGEVERAAFVLADLLDRPVTAAELLAR
jgi:hypothetical protein